MQRRFSKELPSLPAIAEFVDEFALSAGLNADVAMRLHLAIEELTTNMMKYSVGAGRHLEIVMRRTDRDVVLELIEPDVEEFNPVSNAPNLDTTDLSGRRAGGMGLFMVNQMADVTYRYADRTGFTTLTMRIGEQDV